MPPPATPPGEKPTGAPEGPVPSSIHVGALQNHNKNLQTQANLNGLEQEPAEILKSITKYIWYNIQIILY